MLKIGIGILFLAGCLTDNLYAQGCNGRAASYNVRETKTLRVRAVPSAGCVGTTAVVPVTTKKIVTEYVPVQKEIEVTSYVRVPVAATVQAAPPAPVATAKPLPMTATTTALYVETAEPGRAFPHPVRGLIGIIRNIAHQTTERAATAIRTAATIPHRVVEVTTSRVSSRCR